MSDYPSGELRVVSAVADKQKVILYLEDGNTVTVNQGDHRLQALLDAIIPVTTRGEVAVVNLDHFSVYADFTKQSGGVVRFFRVARQKLGALLGEASGKEVVVVNMEFTPDITAPQMENLLTQVEQHVTPFIDKMAPEAPFTPSTDPMRHLTPIGDAAPTAGIPTDDPQKWGTRASDAYRRAGIGDYVKIEGPDQTIPNGWYQVSMVHEKGVGGNPDLQQRLQVRTTNGNLWVRNSAVKAMQKDPPAAAAPAPEDTPMLAAVDMKIDGKAETIVERLEPVGDDGVVSKDETVVALIGDLMVPDVDKLKPLIQHAVRTNSVISVQNFLKRAAAIISKRAHSVVDLMRFLEQGDLPLAEDGSIIAYKILKRKHGAEPGTFVDCHSGKVKQRVGSYVCVDEKLVDPNRRNECSNGLHIARRGYLGGFGGDVCTLCKIDPEDVMVVPHGDPNKVRVKGYHILAELSKEAFAVLKTNRPMTAADHSSLAVVHQAIKGEHIRRIEEVRIHGQMGSDVVITPIEEPKAEASKRAKKTRVVELTDEQRKQAAAVDDPAHGTSMVEPREINKRVNAEIETIRKPKKAAKKSKSGSKPGVRRSDTAKAKAEKTPAKKAKSGTTAKVLKTKAKTGKPLPREKSKIPSGKLPQGKKNPAVGNDPKGIKDLPPEQREALSLIGKGVSQSEASRKTNVSRRTIGRLVEKYGT